MITAAVKGSTPDGLVNFEIPADDVARAQAFYQKAFEWDAYLVEEVGYVNLSTGPTDMIGRNLEPNAINGGLMRREGALSGPVFTISVEDIDAALERIAELGGTTVVPKIQVFDFGLKAYFADTEGNIIGLWQDLRPGDADYGAANWDDATLGSRIHRDWSTRG